MVIARVNEKSSSETGLESGFCCLCFHQNCRRSTWKGQEVICCPQAGSIPTKLSPTDIYLTS